MKVDRKQLENLETSFTPTVHTVKVDLHRLEKLGLCEIPVHGPVKIDKKQLRLLAAMPMPQTSVHAVKVDLTKLEELGLYKKPDDVPDIAWYTMYKKQAFVAASFTVGAIGLCSLYIIFGSKTNSGSTDMVVTTSQNTPVIKYISDEELEDIILTNIVPVSDVTEDKPVENVGGVQNIFQRIVLDEQAAETIDEVPMLFADTNLAEGFVSPVLNSDTVEGFTVEGFVSPVLDIDAAVSDAGTNIVFDKTFNTGVNTDIDSDTNVVSDRVSDEDINNVSDEDVNKTSDMMSNGTLDLASAGVSDKVLDIASDTVSNVVLNDDSDKEVSEEKSEDDGPALVMVKDVQTSLSVRKEASDNSEKAGLLYNDCGGTMLDQKDGWTLIESGELTGWVKDDFLLFDEEAQEKADEVGELVATVEVQALNIRKEPATDATILAVASTDDTFTVSEVIEDGWIEVEFKDDAAYISLDYADVELQVPTGETMEVVEQREKEEKAAREKAAKEAKAAEEAKAAQGLFEPAVTTITGDGVTLDDTGLNMLAAIIYCEAGNQSYDGQVAVGAVVVNRLLSPKFPNGIEEVIRAPRQFQPVSQGKFDRVYSSGSWSESAMNAAREAVAGNKVSVGNALYFKNPKIAGAHSGVTIGDHVFW